MLSEFVSYRLKFRSFISSCNSKTLRAQRRTEMNTLRSFLLRGVKGSISTSMSMKNDSCCITVVAFGHLQENGGFRMRRVSGCLIMAVFFAFLCVPLTAVAATLSGSWKGTANRVTKQGCSVINVSFTTKCARGNVATGTLILGNYTFSVLAKIDAKNIIEIENADGQIIVNLYGKYVAGTPSKIVIHTVYILDYTKDINEVYDTFILTKQ